MRRLLQRTLHCQPLSLPEVPETCCFLRPGRMSSSIGRPFPRFLDTLPGICAAIRRFCTAIRHFCTVSCGSCTSIRGFRTAIRGFCTSIRGFRTSIRYFCTVSCGSCTSVRGFRTAVRRYSSPSQRPTLSSFTDPRGGTPPGAPAGAAAAGIRNRSGFPGGIPPQKAGNPSEAGRASGSKKRRTGGFCSFLSFFLLERPGTGPSSFLRPAHRRGIQRTAAPDLFFRDFQPGGKPSAVSFVTVPLAERLPTLYLRTIFFV